MISHTTRNPRPEETDGKKYHFTSRKAFIDSDIRGEFIQTVEIDEHFYGIKKADIEAAIAVNPVVYVIVNRSGANKFKYEFGDRAIRGACSYQAACEGHHSIYLSAKTS